MAAIRKPTQSNSYWKSTYHNDYQFSGSQSERREPIVPRFRDIEPVLMARPLIFKSHNAAGKPSGRFEDSSWSSIYRQSYKSHHLNRFENVTAATARESIQRPLILPPLQTYPSYSGALTDRGHYNYLYNPVIRPKVADSEGNRHWKSTYKDSYHGYDEDLMQPLVYYQPVRLNWPYYQHPVPAPPVLDSREDWRSHRIDNRDYLGEIETVQDPPQFLPPVAPKVIETKEPRPLGRLNQHLFYDDHFDPKDKSFLLMEKFSGGEIKWLRPNELSVKPSLVSKHYITSDFKQGFLQNSWFLMACAAISRFPNLLKIVLPSDQSLVGNDYSGKVICNFYLFGSWKTIAIDDRLPCYGDDLAFARCDNPDEFWVSLIEKAYAKVFGSYEALELGNQRDALTDLTGGICEFYNLHQIAASRVDLEHALFMGSKFHAMMTCSRNPLDANNEQEYRTGLISGHGYEVTGVFLVPWERGGEEVVLRIQAPWDYTKPWTGSWSDLDPRWRTFTPEFKDFVGFHNKPIGEFFISYKDFLKQFYHVSICHLETTLHSGQSRDNLGFFSSHHGEWVTGINAGGSTNYPTTYHTNPQFHAVIDPSRVQDDLYKDDKVLLLVSLMLPDNRGKQRPLPYIGFSIYEVNSEKSYLPLTKEYLMANLPIASSGKFRSRKEVVSRFRLSPGEIVIVPTTYYPERDSAFMLRLFCHSKFTVQSFSAS